MNRALFLFMLVFFLFAPLTSKGVIFSNPLDLSGINKSQTQSYLSNLAGRTIEVAGTLKDASELAPFLGSMIYEIPIYAEKDGIFKKYGFVCQREGSPNIFFAEDGYLAMFVRKNALGKMVLARGRLVRNKKDLPKGIVFVIDSLNLQENK